MIKELIIPSSAGFCKHCFNPRRKGSSFCGECQDYPERMKTYLSDEKFPLLNDVLKEFDISDRISNIAFTYGNTIYAKRDLSPGLVAHEVIHVLQQTDIGKEIWWERYLSDFLFRLEQELKAYRNQYRVLCEYFPKISAEELDRISRDLSGPMYGNIINFDKAKKLIMNK